MNFKHFDITFLRRTLSLLLLKPGIVEEIRMNISIEHKQSRTIMWLIGRKLRNLR